VSEIINQIKEYFVRRGYRILSVDEVSSDVKPSLAFTDGESTIYVKVFSEEELSDRNSLLDAVLQSLRLIEKANRVYLALPKIYSTILDGRILQRHGLGLLICGGSGVTEAIPARQHEISVHEGLRSDEMKMILDGLHELRDLKRRVSELEETVKMLSEEISRLKSMRVRVRAEEMKSPPVSVKIPQELPSFFKDNPWLEILTRRGQERASA